MGLRNLSLFRVMVTIYERLSGFTALRLRWVGHFHWSHYRRTLTMRRISLALERQNIFDMLMGFGPSAQIYIRIKY